MRALVLFCVLASSLAHAASDGELAASKDATFRRGNEAYFKGRYAEAVEAYEQVIALGVVSEDVYFNLGNAYLKAGQVGPAIFNYERALELEPGNDDVTYNLKTARDLARGKGEDRLVGAEATPLWMRLVMPFTLGALGWVFLSVYSLVFGLLIALRFVQPGFLRVSLWAVFVFVVIGAVVSGALLGGRLYLAERVEQAIVLPDLVSVKEGPDANYTALFRIHAGLRVRITEKDQDWVRVRLANGLEGWVRERELGRL